VNALGERIARLIEAQGPISVAQFMTMALLDPQGGYYATRDPFGARGDFITAPEISQMFGELLGLWIVQCWLDQGKPGGRLVELGPGRGTLMTDALRAARLVPEFLAAMEVVLVEASPTLTEIQKETLKDHPIRWTTQFDDALADKPLFLLANEFFDALPIRQFVKTERGWCERMVVNAGDKLDFALSPEAIAITPPNGVAAPIGGFYETSPASTALMQRVADVIAHKGGAALIVDYGYEAGAGFGETLQAMADHKFASVLEAPGEADLTAHVDFNALADASRAGGAQAFGPKEQGDLLVSLGIVQRAERLANQQRSGAKLSGHLYNTPLVQQQLNRLVEPDQMGTLFKALAIMPKSASAPPGF
jgi:NADH dehydrogenase [ubiquinone] 1 alpha subcomplex assembly factor 7